MTPPDQDPQAASPDAPAAASVAFAVDLVIPARNEAINIPAMMAALPRASLRHIVVADNGSTDDTAALARAAGAVVVHETQPGYGAACLAALKWIAEQPDPPAAVAFFDADLADDPDRLPELAQPIHTDAADLVIGSRRKLAASGSLTPVQRFGNGLACFLIRLTTGAKFHDLGPMRVVRWSSLQQLHMADRTWGWTVEMQCKAAVLNLRCKDVHVPYRPRRAGQSKISGTIMGSAKAGWKILYTVAALTLTKRRIRRTAARIRNAAINPQATTALSEDDHPPTPAASSE